MKQSGSDSNEIPVVMAFDKDEYVYINSTLGIGYPVKSHTQFNKYELDWNNLSEIEGLISHCFY